VDNDADDAVLAEAGLGDARQSDRFLDLTIRTGIGGILLDRKLYRGARAAQPELEHTNIDAANGPPCCCWADGCWESPAGGAAIAAWFHSQQATSSSPTTAEFRRMAEQGDALALKAMDRLGQYLGTGLSKIIAAFTPETAGLGGGVMRSHHPFLPRAFVVIDEPSLRSRRKIHKSRLHPCTRKPVCPAQPRLGLVDLPLRNV
jgi:glucokinase